VLGAVAPWRALVTSIEIDGRLCEVPELIGGVQGGGFAFGLYKAGSSLLNRTLRQLCRNSNVEYVDVLKQFREAGTILETAKFSAAARESVRDYLDHRGIVFSGWREFPTNYDLPLRSETHTYLLVRDPRDMITSLYFSLKYSHPTTGLEADYILPERERLQNVDIDSFARQQAAPIARYFAAYAALSDTQLMLRRYEDIVFDRARFVAELCQHFGLEVPQRKMDVVAERNDERPESEDVHAHVRQVTPGDHAKKLAPATVALLNERLKDVLQRYDYKPHVAAEAD
jgi:hypothetical protein